MPATGATGANGGGSLAEEGTGSTNAKKRKQARGIITRFIF
jgi:hypothetical protein